MLVKHYFYVAPIQMFLIFSIEGILFSKEVTKNAKKKRKRENESTHEEYEFKYKGTLYKSRPNVIRFLDLRLAKFNVVI